MPKSKADMQVTFLGTGTSQGVPIIGCPCNVCQSTDVKDKRLRSSVHVKTDSLSIVIDTGPDFRQQMLRSRIYDLDAVIFTHGHKDHTAGFDDIRAYNFMLKRDMEVYADAEVDRVLRKDFDYVFQDFSYPGVPRANVHVFDNKAFKINGVNIIPIQVYHHKLPVFGFRIGDFVYITDANFIPEIEKVKIKGAKVLVLNALRKEAHISHFTLQEAVDLALELGIEQTYFTHISHQLGKHQEVNNELPEGIQLANDELVLTL